MLKGFNRCTVAARACALSAAIYFTLGGATGWGQAAPAPGVTARPLALELDGYADWKVNSHFTASFVVAYADPQAAVQQAINRTASFKYGMVFLAYSY